MNQNLRHKDLIHPASSLSGTEARLHAAAINAGMILEPSGTDPRQIRHVIPAEGKVTRPAALPASTMPRPAPGQGLRLLPLSGFFWGGAMRSRFGPGLKGPGPRVRGDHVILWVRQGSVAIEFPRRQQSVKDGRLAFIPVGTAFALRPPSEVAGWALLIPAGQARDLPVPLPQDFRTGQPDGADMALLEPAFRALGQGHPQDSVERGATSCQIGLLATALSRLCEHNPDFPALRDPQLLDARPLTEQFLAHAAESLRDNRTVAELARELGCTLPELEAACQQSRGRTALDLLYVLRLDRAVDMLREGSMSDLQIARELGYSGLGHFMRVFAAATGRSPQAFRDCLHAERPEGD